MLTIRGYGFSRKKAPNDQGCTAPGNCMLVAAFYTPTPGRLKKESATLLQLSPLNHVCPICYVPREFWIAVTTEVTHRVPEIYCPLTFVLHEGRESCGASGQELVLIAATKRRAIPFPGIPALHRGETCFPPSVPSTNHGPNDLVLEVATRRRAAGSRIKRVKASMPRLRQDLYLA
jgi:hypothetical protein